MLSSEFILEEPDQFDDISDNLVATRLTGFSEDFDADVPFCDVGDNPGVILLEDIIVQNFEGGPLEINPIETTTRKQIINGREVNMIVINTPDIEGIMGVSDIRIGITPEAAAVAPSLGGIFTTNATASTFQIYRSIE